MPARDDILVTRLREARAVLIGKARLPEFGHNGFTDGPNIAATPIPCSPSRNSGGAGRR